MFYVVRALSPYTEYEFYVIAVNNIGRGPASIPATCTTGETGNLFFFFSNFFTNKFFLNFELYLENIFFLSIFSHNIFSCVHHGFLCKI